MEYPGKFWDEYFSAREGLYTLLVKRLVNVCGRRIDLHKMLHKDNVECLHSHPANSVRIILIGGYVEEVRRPDHSRFMQTWYPGMMGIVRPNFVHRIHALNNGSHSYSLWLRGRVTHPIYAIGSGWGADEDKWQWVE